MERSSCIEDKNKGIQYQDNIKVDDNDSCLLLLCLLAFLYLQGFTFMISS